MRYTVARETPSAAAIVVAGSPEACIRRASFALEASRALGRPDCLSASATGLTGGCAPLLPQFQFKLREAGENTGNHPASGGRSIDALAEAPQHDVAFVQIADGLHDLSGVAAQAVDSYDNDCYNAI